jgi:signal transduction histidine kinase
VSQLTITKRLITLVTVPLVFTGAFAAWALATTGGEAVSAARLKALVSLADQAAVVADRLQQERADATLVLAGSSPFAQLVAYQSAATATDAAVGEYERLRADVSAGPAITQALLARIDDQMNRLPALRDEVRESPTVALSAVTFAYRITIADLVSLRDSAAQAEGTSADLVARLRAAGALSHATEFISLMQVQVLQSALIAGPMTPADQQSIAASSTGYRDATTTFGELAGAQWQDWLDHALTGPDVLSAQRLEDLVTRTSNASTVDIQAWTASTGGQIALLHQVERRIDAAVHADVDAAYGATQTSLAIEAGLVVLALVAAVVLATAQSRSMIRRLRGLAQSARNTAFISLPATVETLMSIGTQTVDAEAFADQAEAPVADTGQDEIGDVSKAFLSVHRQAIRTAADLANMRAGMSQIFLHLARRNQRLVGILMRELDGAERGEGDPDRLATLFRLDQLATRMGRYTDNLLVVGGQSASRADAADVDLDTVVRAAQSKIEHYARVRVAGVDDRLMVRGTAVHDVVGLLAELLDNATQFSSPHSTVDVLVDQSRHDVVVLVRDAGVGIPDWRLEQFNQAFVTPPTIDISAIRSMGLTVVAHIAAWHRIGVRLVPGPDYGTVAEIALPASVCRTRFEPAVVRSGHGGQALSWSPRPSAPRPVPTRPVDPPIYRGVASGFAGFLEPSTSGSRWQGLADGGWTAAANAATPETNQPTRIGLPRRPPLANLVPGSVQDRSGAGAAVDHRDPASIAASVAAFAFGRANSQALHTPSPAPKEHR